MAKENKETKEKDSLVVLSPEEHLKKYPKREYYMLKNKLKTPLSVNVCSGKEDHFWTYDENGIKTINPNASEQVKTCPGHHVQLLGLENKLVSVCEASCLNNSDHVKALSENGHLAIRKSNASGKAGDSLKFE